MQRIDQLFLAAAMAALLGCHPGDSPPEPLDPGAPPAEPSGPAPSGDALPQAAPLITSVVNEDGGHELRQSSSSHIVITGVNLATATAVTVGDNITMIDSATATELLVTVFTLSGHPIGPMTVTVTTPEGTATRPGGLAMTPYVISPTAIPGIGRGTYESPMHLCDGSLFLANGPGDTIELLGGVHECAGAVNLNGGGTVQGAADGSTVVKGEGGVGFSLSLAMGAPPQFTTTVRRLTFAEPLLEQSLSIYGGNVVVTDLTDAGGVLVAEADEVFFEGYTYEGSGAAGTFAVDIEAYDVWVGAVNVRCGSGGDGVRVRQRNSPFPGGSGAIQRVRAEHCGNGLTLGGPVGPGQFRTEAPFLDVSSVELLDNEVGLSLVSGSITMRDPIIRGDDSTPLVSTHGVSADNGNLTLLGGKIGGVTIAGIDVHTSSSGGGPFEAACDLVTDGVEIVGARYGVIFHGWEGSSDLTMRRSIVREQTVASVRVSGYDSLFDLGSALSPGENALSVVSGFALEDARTDSLNEPYVLAIGTTLNGHSYDGQTIQGPAEVPLDYVIRTFSGAIQF